LHKKGKGVYTKKLLKSGTLIPYGGKLTLLETVEDLCKQSRERVSYIAGTRNKNIYFDVHPILYPRNAASHGWIGSLINEPNISQQESENAKLVTVSRIQQKDIPKYPHIKMPLLVAVEIIKDVQQGNEILMKYNWDFHEVRWLNMKKCHSIQNENKSKRKEIGQSLTVARKNRKQI
jgi:hypothetical protein